MGYRKLHRLADLAIRQPERAYRISHYYCQFLKTDPQWYFDLRPNVDMDGRSRFPAFPDCGWTLFTNKPFRERYSERDERNVDDFFACLLGATGFQAIVLNAYPEALERV